MLDSLQRRWKTLIALALAGLLAVALGSCSLQGLRGEAAQPPSLLIANISDPTTFNPPLNDSLFSTYVFGLINRGLVSTNGLTGEIEPELAESWTISQDQKSIVFTLRPNLKWSDGAPLTADDVLFSFNDVYLNEDVPTSTRNILETGDGSYPQVSKLSDNQVKFTVTQPYAPLLRNSGVSLLPKHILAPSLKEKDENGGLRFLSTWGTTTPPEQIVVNGPYQIASYEPSQRLTFKPNPHYWRREEGREEGLGPLPRIQRIIMQIVESDTSQMIRFRSGELDSLEVKPEAFPLLKQEEKRGQFTVYNGGPSSDSRLLSFNLNRASRDGKPLVDPIKSQWFNEQRFRQAVAYGLNRQQMQDNIFRGIGAVQNSPLDVTSPYYAEAGVPRYDYDPAKAKALLQEAGFTYDQRGGIARSPGQSRGVFPLGQVRRKGAGGHGGPDGPGFGQAGHEGQLGGDQLQYGVTKAGPQRLGCLCGRVWRRQPGTPQRF